MKKFKLLMNVEINSDSALDAAKEYTRWIEQGYKPTYYAMDCTTNEICSVDLQEDDEESLLMLNEDNESYNILKTMFDVF